MSRRAVFVVVAIEGVRVPSVPFVCSLSASLLVRHGVPGGGDGVRPDTTGHAVSGRLSDRGVHCGRRTRPRGHGRGPALRTFGHRAWVQVVTAVSPGAGSGWGCPKASMRIVVLSGHDPDERAAVWPWSAGHVHGRTLGGGGVRRSAVAVRTGSVPIGWAATLHWDVRTVERSAMSVARPAAAGCPQEELVGGDGVQAGVRRLHLGGSGRPAGLRASPARHGRGPRGAHQAVQGWRAGRRAAPARRSASATDRADGRVWRRGRSVGIGKWLPSVGASRPGALLGGG